MRLWGLRNVASVRDVAMFFPFSSFFHSVLCFPSFAYSSSWCVCGRGRLTSGCVTEQLHFPSLSIPLYLCHYSCSFFSHLKPLSLSSVCFLLHVLSLLSLPISLLSTLGPLLSHSPLLSFLKSLSLSLSFYSLLLCCIPVPVVKGWTRKREGRRGRGNLSFREGGKDGKGEGGPLSL